MVVTWLWRLLVQPACLASCVSFSLGRRVPSPRRVATRPMLACEPSSPPRHCQATGYGAST
eukprot:8994773-Alexandrium_andersonii.AAC.1